MTPKDKAIEFFDKMKGFRVKHSHSKKCALIAVDEILNTNTLRERNCGFVKLCEQHKEYWQEVKTELEKL